MVKALGKRLEWNSGRDCHGLLAERMDVMGSLLIVENNEFFRRLLKDFLSRRFPDLVIDEAADGERALLQIMAHPPDIILMDVQLGGQSGLKLTKQIKHSYPESSILLFSNYDLPELRKIAHDNGADRLIHKDKITEAGIPEFIQTVLANQRQRNKDSATAGKAKHQHSASTTPYRQSRPQERCQLPSSDVCY